MKYRRTIFFIIIVLIGLSFFEYNSYFKYSKLIRIDNPIDYKFIELVKKDGRVDGATEYQMKISYQDKDFIVKISPSYAEKIPKGELPKVYISHEGSKLFTDSKVKTIYRMFLLTVSVLAILSIWYAYNIVYISSKHKPDSADL